MHYQQFLLLPSLSTLQIMGIDLIFTGTHFGRFWNVICAQLQLYFYPQMASKTCFPCTVIFCEISYPPAELFCFLYWSIISAVCTIGRLIFPSCIIETVSHYTVNSSIFNASLVYFMAENPFSFVSYLSLIVNFQIAVNTKHQRVLLKS